MENQNAEYIAMKKQRKYVVALMVAIRESSKFNDFIEYYTMARDQRPDLSEIGIVNLAVAIWKCVRHPEFHRVVELYG